jgi:hypothetical protein
VEKSEVVTLWRATGRAERDLVAAARWREWPPPSPGRPDFQAFLDPALAAAATRERHVPAGGEGFVIRFGVRRAFLDRYEAAGPEYHLPAGDLGALNANLAGAIVEEAHHRGAVAGEEFDRAAAVLGRPLPRTWRAYLRGPWFHRGWLPSGCFVWLYTPREALEIQEAWDEGAAAHPGVAVIGGNGAREQFVLDLRRDPSPVLMVDITSEGWDAAIRQAADVERFVAAVEAGTFDLTW